MQTSQSLARYEGTVRSVPVCAPRDISRAVKFQQLESFLDTESASWLQLHLKYADFKSCGDVWAGRETFAGRPIEGTGNATRRQLMAGLKRDGISEV